MALLVSLETVFEQRYLWIDKIWRRPPFLLSPAHFLANYVKNCSNVPKLRTILQLHCRYRIANLVCFNYRWSTKKWTSRVCRKGGCEPTRRTPPLYAPGSCTSNFTFYRARGHRTSICCSYFLGLYQLKDCLTNWTRWNYSVGV